MAYRFQNHVAVHSIKGSNTSVAMNLIRRSPFKQNKGILSEILNLHIQITLFGTKTWFIISLSSIGNHVVRIFPGLKINKKKTIEQSMLYRLIKEVDWK